MKVTQSITNTPLFPLLKVVASDAGPETTHVVVLHEDEKIRQTLMVNDDNIARTYTAVSKNSEWKTVKEMLQADRAITLGVPIAEAFSKQGFQVRKNILDVYTISLTPRLRKSFGTIEAFAKANNSELIVRTPNRIYHYGMMIEIFSPVICSAKVTDNDTQFVNFSFHTLKAAGFSNEEVWNLLESEAAEWSTSTRFEHL
jgi:hypothetical protein